MKPEPSLVVFQMNYRACSILPPKCTQARALFPIIREPIMAVRKNLAHSIERTTASGAVVRKLLSTPEINPRRGRQPQ